MTLQTLGGLELPGSSFARPKPLLLLAYLSLQGPQERRYLAELFWPENADALNSLSVTLSRLRRGTQGTVEADEVRVWTPLKTDAEELAKALVARQHEATLALYKGPFLEGVYLEDWGAELEEWVYQKREALATQMRGVYLSLAEQTASKGQFEQATAQAEAAYLLKAAPEPEPEDLRRLYPLLLVGRSPQATQVQHEAHSLGFGLQQTPEEARASFQKQQVLLGRGRELARLRDLSEGTWAWVRGGAGMGKTTLLKALEGQYLPGRSGLPYATLEPLLGADLSEGEEVLLRKLAKQSGTLLLDGWEQTDPESQKLLTRLRGLKPNLRVVMASRTDPPFEVGLLLDLGPLSAQDLQAYPGAFEATGGLPGLVGAFLRGEPLEAAFETRLVGLSAAAREVVLALGLLEQPDLALVRRALGLGAGQMAQALDSLQAAGLLDATGRLQAQTRVRDWLEGRQTLGAGLSIKLARLLEGVGAFGLWQRARLLWEEGDTAKVQESYIAWAKELLRRGFPKKAVEALEGAPDGEDIRYWRGRSLERCGKYLEALSFLENISEIPESIALKSFIYWRLGKMGMAKTLAAKALNMTSRARAEAMTVLANIALSEGRYREAISFYDRASILWHAENDLLRMGDALVGQAIALVELDKSSEEIYSDLLSIFGEKPYLKARILMNLGMAYEQKGQILLAEKCLLEASALSYELGLFSTCARAWNSLGVVYHNLGRHTEARNAYNTALEIAKQTHEVLTTATILGNLAELNLSIEAMEEAIALLEKGGYSDMVNRSKKILQTMKNP